jgi:Group II intron, maturase-specific domain
MIFSCYAGALMPRDAPDMNGVSHTVEITFAAFYEAVSPCPAATNRLPESPRGSNVVKVSVADIRVEHEVRWANYFCLGPVSKAYRAVDQHARKRLRQWLCAKHKVSWPATKRFPAASLHEVLGLVRLTKRTSNFPWATS